MTGFSHSIVRRFLRIATAATAAGLLGGCALFGSHGMVDALNRAEPVGDPFTVRLAEEYRAFANEEQSEMFDFFDARLFAEKGLDAADGIAIPPENPRHWRISGDALQDLIIAYDELNALLDGGGRSLAPDQAAIAQARFDCWVEQQEEAWQATAIMACRIGYERAADALRLALDTARPAVMPASLPQARPIAPTTTIRAAPAQPAPVARSSRPARFLLFFDFGQAGMNEISVRVVPAIAREVAMRNARRITIVGHTDRRGSDAANQALSERRAREVYDALRALGVPAELMTVIGAGETQPLVPGPDGDPNPANRRVEVVVG